MKKIKWWWLLLAALGCFILSMALPDSLEAVSLVAFVAAPALLVWSIVRLIRSMIDRSRARKQLQPPTPSDATQATFPASTRKDAGRGSTHARMITPNSPAMLQRLCSGGYVVFDVETTGLDPMTCKVIEYAMLRCNTDGTEDELCGFCDPGGPIPPHIKKLTGITYRNVAGKPAFADVAGDLITFARGLPIVAHNGSFDAAFLTEALNEAGTSVDFLVLDTLSLARQVFPGRSSYKLDALIHDLALWDQPQTHRAMDDVRCTNTLLLRCIDELTGRQPSVYRAAAPTPAANIPSVSSDALTGKLVAFTGDLTIDRTSAQDLAQAAGGIIRTNVSRKTDYLILGTHDPYVVGADGMSHKERLARELNASGQGHIQIIDEAEFFRLISR